MASRTWTDKLGRSYAYTPHALPFLGEQGPRLENAATLAVAQASSALGSLPGLPLAGVAAVLYRSESSASSLIEGEAAGPRRILEAEFAGPGEIEDPVAARVIQNLEGLRDALETPLPATTEDLLRWHRRLTEGHPTLDPDSVGALRREQNWIGGDSTGPRGASYIPPAQEDLPGLMADLQAFSSRTDLAPVVQAAIAHAHFEAIHPFVDGNGRVGRMLLQHLLVGRLRLSGPVPISVPWSRDPDRYLEGLRAYQNGHLDPWIEFAGTSIVVAVAWMREAAARISDLLAAFQAAAATRGISAASRIIADLPTHPLIDAGVVSRRYGISRQAASDALTRLERRGVLKERAFARRLKPRGRPTRTFAAPEFLDLLEDLLRSP